jgi:hypothetical protein
MANEPFWVKQKFNVPLSYQQQYPLRKKLNLDIEESRHLGYDPTTLKDIPILKKNLSNVKREDLKNAIEAYKQANKKKGNGGKKIKTKKYRKKNKRKTKRKSKKR